MSVNGSGWELSKNAKNAISTAGLDKIRCLIHSLYSYLLKESVSIHLVRQLNDKENNHHACY